MARKPANTFRVKIISPLKATAADLERRPRRYAAQAAPYTKVKVLNLEGGPAALNNSGDILSSAAAIFRQGSALSPTDTDAILIDCVFDPAVDELREATSIPTFGPTHTTLPLIAMVAANFTIIARSQRQCELLGDLVATAGYGNRLNSLRALDISYEEAKQPALFERVMEQRLRAAVDEDGAQAIMFGSTTMALGDILRTAAGGRPLFMPGMTALSVLEYLWRDGLWPAASPARKAGRR
jgi:allantoin racemase